MYPHLFIILLLTLISCGSSKEGKVESAIDLAQTYLSSAKCDDALAALEEASGSKDSVYLQVKSSAYGCKANVEVVEVITELEGFDATQVLNELSQKSFADSLDLVSYHFLTKAVDILLSSTSQVSQSEREKEYGLRKGQDMGMQLLVYSIVQVSKFVNYFGNTLTGKKGDRGGVNNCFLDYSTNPTLLTLLPASNSCASISDGHPELNLTELKGRENACHGIILINNILDTVDTIEFGNSKNLKVLKDISEKLSSLRDSIALVNPSLEFLFEVRDQASCLDLSEDEIMTYIFAIYEVGFQ